MASVKTVCVDCGHVFEVERRELKRVDGELQEIAVSDARRQAKREQAQASTIEDLIQVGKRRGMKNPTGWARHVMAARQAKGHWRRVA
jgi:hypothetical protein